MHTAEKPPFQPRPEKIQHYLRPDLCPFRAAQRALAHGETGEAWRQRIAALPRLVEKPPVDLFGDCIDRRRWSEAEAFGVPRYSVQAMGLVQQLIHSADDAAWEWIKRLRLRPGVSSYASTWLAAACEVGRADWVNDLLEWGASPNAPSFYRNFRLFSCDMRIRPLVYAVGFGERECVHALLEAGANPNQVSATDYSPGVVWMDDRPSHPSRFTALMLAEISGDKEIERDLIIHGADPDLTRRLGLDFMDYHSFQIYAIR